MALAVGAAFVAPAALADVTISGAINMGIAYVDSDDSTGGGGGESNFQLTNNYSNVTISSVDDLGGGLKLDFAFQVVTPLTTAGTPGSNVINRNSHIGLVSESWGGVWYGTNENLYERYFYSIDPLDGAAGIGGNLQMLGTPGFGTVFDTGQLQCGPGAGCAGFYRRTDQTIWYDSPSFGGLTFGAYITTTAGKSGATGDTNPQVYGIGAKYVGTGLPIQAWVATEIHNDLFGLDAGAAGAGVPNSGTATGSDDNAIQAGVGYTLGDIFIFVNFEMLSYENDGGIATDLSKYERDAFSVGMKWNLASGYIGAQYIQAMEGDCDLVGGGACNADDTDGKMIGVGYYHTMSKQTQAYIMGSWIDNGDAQNYNLAGASVVNSGLGADHLAVTVGLKHSF
jgi:predicted porin